tara:strand:+ start:756 stop:1097 length:342 start_codon:yes stop_codon:yes gene_type:complete
MSIELKNKTTKCPICGDKYQDDMISSYDNRLCKWCDENYFYSEIHDKFFDLKIFSFLDSEYNERINEKDTVIRRYPYQVLQELLHIAQTDEDLNFKIKTARDIIENELTKTDT